MKKNECTIIVRKNKWFFIPTVSVSEVPKEPKKIIETKPEISKSPEAKSVSFHQLITFQYFFLVTNPFANRNIESILSTDLLN